MGEALTIISSKMMKLILTVGLLVAIDPYSAKKNDIVSPLKSGKKIFHKSTGAKSNSTRQSSLSYPEGCSSWGWSPSLAVKRAVIEGFKLFSSTSSAVHHAWEQSPSGTTFVIAFPSGYSWYWNGMSGVIQCVNYKGYDIVFINKYC